MESMEESDTIADSFMREKRDWFGETRELVLVTESGKEMSIGGYPQLGNEGWSSGRRPAEILDAAGIEVISIDGVPFDEWR